MAPKYCAITVGEGSVGRNLPTISSDVYQQNWDRGGRSRCVENRGSQKIRDAQAPDHDAVIGNEPRNPRVSNR